MTTFIHGTDDGPEPKERRWARIRIAAPSLANLFVHLSRGGHLTMDGLPRTMRAVHMNLDAEREIVDLIVESEDFMPVLEGAPIPEVVAYVTTWASCEAAREREGQPA